MRLRIAFLVTDFISFFLFIRRFITRSLRLCCFRNLKFLPDFQFAWVVNMIERDQIGVGDLQFLCDCDWIITLYYNVSLS